MLQALRVHSVISFMEKKIWFEHRRVTFRGSLRYTIISFSDDKPAKTVHPQSYHIGTHDVSPLLLQRLFQFKQPSSTFDNLPDHQAGWGWHQLVVWAWKGKKNNHESVELQTLWSNKNCKMTHRACEMRDDISNWGCVTWSAESTFVLSRIKTCTKTTLMHCYSQKTSHYTLKALPNNMISSVMNEESAVYKNHIMIFPLFIVTLSSPSMVACLRNL